jgi:outer membrane protein TolC
LLSACDLAPDYKVPPTPDPAAFKETGPWIVASAQDALPRGQWWTLYGDAALNNLESRIENANPDLAVALARYDAAQGYLTQAQSSLFLTIDLGDLLWRRHGGCCRQLGSGPVGQNPQRSGGRKI